MQDLSGALDHFLAQLTSQSLLDADFTESDVTPAELDAILAVYAGEARSTYQLIQDFLSKDIRILEVGSGLCLLSLFLKSQGFKITALEPAVGGFGHFAMIKNAVLKQHRDCQLQVLEKTAQQLNSEFDGEFDLIFSNNVLEHIPSLEEAVASMANVLAADGQMVHTCPNYIVPYEPHLAIPVIKWFPLLSRRVWSNKVSENLGLWKSLNFVGYFDIRAIARRQRLQVSFKTKVMFDAIDRLSHDAQFADRHIHSPVGVIFRFLKKTRLLAMVKCLPPFISTPMVFYLKHR